MTVLYVPCVLNGADGFWAAAMDVSGGMFLNFNQITNMKTALEMGALKLSVNISVNTASISERAPRLF